MALSLLSPHIMMLCALSLCTSSLGEGPLCPYTWFRPAAANSSNNCTCGNSLGGIVQCDSNTKEVKILVSYCMTYDSTSHETVVGSCPNFPTAGITNGYVPLPVNVTDLNHAVCNPHHREGRLCGKCQPGFSSNPLTYEHECTQCNKSQVGHWIAFFAYQFLPVTSFFFTILLLNLESVSGPATAFIFFAQVYSSRSNIRLLKILSEHMSGTSKETIHNYESFLFTYYGIWNLDFGRLFLRHFCLEASITTLAAVAMEYIIPFYLLLLTILIFTVVELHGRGFKPVVVVWKPLATCFSKFRKEWKITDSLIRPFALFILLSYNRLVAVSIRILNGSFMYDINGKRRGIVPYFSTENDYFHKEHAAFAALAIFTLITLVAIPPIVLLLYPLRACHVCMGVFCHARLQYGLKTFVESFQGCYKDGSSNRYDFRYTAGWYFVLRIIVAVGEFDNAFSTHFGQQIIIFTLFLTALGFALLQPYKKHLLNWVDAFHFAALSMFNWLLLNNMYMMLLDRGSYALWIMAILSTLPCIYFTLLTIYWVCIIKKFPQRLCRCLKCGCVRLRKSGFANMQEPNSQTSLTQGTGERSGGSFADRLANPTAYDALIASRRNILTRHVRTSTLLVHEETQTSGRTFLGQGKQEESVRAPQQLPTRSVVDISSFSQDKTVRD